MSEKLSRKAELRTRWRSALEAGSLASLRSEGRLVALYVFLKADWATCQIRLSMRKAARDLGVQSTAVRRGVTQLVAAGMLRNIRKSDSGQATVFEVQRCAQGVRTPDTQRAHPRAQGVRTPDTTRAHPAHTPCAPRARLVRSVRTRCAHDSVLPSGISVNTSGITSTATPTAGEEPAAACRQDEEGPAAVSSRSGP